MVELTLKTTVNEVLQRYPEAVSLLNELGIDTCCGGADPLEEAARQAGKNPEEVLTALLAFLGRRGYEPSEEGPLR
ncbi:DUF542 domain-containing protein [Thermus neutrinimicus]|uniref:DUF542 domain-containing protein n=1 Tax=Thermus neutrinimicus TaxID=2908149 RepID=UPI001FA9F296|nr:DUF542 domain-containing protein [Thermus neutrinimicus]